MFDVEAAIEAWMADAVRIEPLLESHRVELTDHLRTVADAMTAAGMKPQDAFESAIAELGGPTMLAAEYRKRGMLASHLQRLRDPARGATRREELTLAAAWIVFSLCWAAVMIFVDGSETWAIFGWVLTVYGPLTVLSTVVARRRPDCERVDGGLKRLLRRT